MIIGVFEMRKIAIFWICVMSCVLMCACSSESELERAIKEEEYLNSQYKKAVDDYNSLKRDKATYDYYQDLF